jgi:hypothetical protein
MLQSHAISKTVLLLFLLSAQPIVGLTLEAKVEDRGKYSPIKPSRLNNIVETNESKKVNLPSTSDTFNNFQEQLPNSANETGYDGDESRIVLVEPYKSLLQATTRFAVAQSSLTGYVNVDTAMDVISDAGYALSKPAILMSAFKIVAIIIATVTAGAFLVPASLVHALDVSFRNPDRLLRIDRYLPDNFNKMDIVRLLNEKSDELLERFGLNDSACREQTVCQVGELLRCTFPKKSKIFINFISENVSRPKYRSKKYFSAFLSGFIDQNCTTGNGDSQKVCASNFVKSFTFCTPQKSPSGPKPNC